MFCWVPTWMARTTLWGHVVACDQRRIHAGGDGRENNHIATSVAPADQGTVFRIGQDVSDAAGERRVFFAGPYRG